MEVVSTNKASSTTGLRRFFSSLGNLISICLLIIIVLLCLLGPLFSVHDFEFIYWDYMSMPPDMSRSHYFGTDAIGRDLFVRTLKGGQVSLLVASIATCVSLTIGILYGVISGYLGGKVDQIMMRALDVLYALPFMFIVIALMVIFKGNIWALFLAIGALIWLDIARIVRGQTLVIKNLPFVEAAKALGHNHIHIVIRQIIPQLFGVVIVYMSLTIPQVILIESFLSFLGLGIQEPMTSWGALISEGTADIEIAPWSLLFPSVFLMLTLLCLNHLGDSLRDFFDPHANTYD